MPLAPVASLAAGSVLRARRREAELLSCHQRSRGKESKERRRGGKALVKKPCCWLWFCLVTGSLWTQDPKEELSTNLPEHHQGRGIRAGTAVVVLSEEELLGNTDIPILCNLWRRLVLPCSCLAEGRGSLLKPPAVESFLSRVSFNYENQSLGLH